MKAKRRGIHAARYSTSERLQRVVRVMGDGKERSTREIQRRADVCNAHSCISELRANGFKFGRAVMRVVRGRRRWYYRLKVAA